MMSFVLQGLLPTKENIKYGIKSHGEGSSSWMESADEHSTKARVDLSKEV